MDKTLLVLIPALLISTPSLAQSSPTPNSSTGSSTMQVQRPSPYFKQIVRDDRVFSTKDTKAMPAFKVVPPYPQKLRFLSGIEYPGGSPCSATFEVTQPLRSTLAWYEQSLQVLGWQTRVTNFRSSAHLIATLPKQQSRIDIQLLSVTRPPYRTRIFAKEFLYQDGPIEMIGGGKPVPPEQVPPLH